MADGVHAGRVVLGEVLGPHGVRGALRVRLEGEDHGHLERAECLWLGAGPDDSHAEPYRVKSARAGRPGEALLELHELRTREGAEALGGLLVMGAAALLEALPEGEFYWYQLIGCQVMEEGGRVLGRLQGLLETGAHDVFVVRGEDQQDRLYPAAQDLLREIDVAAERIVIAVPTAIETEAGDADEGTA